MYYFMQITYRPRAYDRMDGYSVFETQYKRVRIACLRDDERGQIFMLCGQYYYYWRIKYQEIAARFALASKHRLGQWFIPSRCPGRCLRQPKLEQVFTRE